MAPSTVKLLAFLLIREINMMKTTAINRQWRYYLVPQFLDAVPPLQFGFSQFEIYQYYNYVKYEMRNVTVNIRPLGIVLSRLRSAVVI